jgi:ATP-binding cassette subfamily B protein
MAAEGHSVASGTYQRQILFSLDTDVRLDGTPVRQWLVITSESLCLVNLSCSENSPAALSQGQTLAAGDVEREFPWSELTAIRTFAGTGSGLLQVQVSGTWVDLLRFSNRLASRFHKISKRLESHLGSSILEPTDLATNLADNESDPLDPPRCPSCDLRLTTAQESCPRCLQKGQILRRVSELLRPHMRGAIFLSLLTIIGVMAELIPPKLQQYMVDHILGPEAAPTGSTSFATALLIVVLALAASRVVLSAVGWIKGRVATVIGTGLTSMLREQMVRKLQQVAVVYYDRHQVGSTLSRVAHDSEVLHGMMHQITGGFLLQTVQLFGVGAMLVWINPKLALYTLIPVPLVFLGSWVFWQRVYPRYYRLWDASSKQMSVLNGMLNGIRVVKAFAQEDREFRRFQTASDHLRHWRLWVDQTNASYSAAMQLVFSLGGLIVWYVGGRDVIGGDMTLGQLIAFLAYLAMFYAPLSALSNFTTWLTSFLSGSKRVLELLDMPLTIAEPADPVAWQDPQGGIRFKNVSFGYDRNQPVLNDISFEVRPGEMIGIVGRSGSGKTTMVNLLGRFYDVQEGAIEVDGIDLRQLSMRQLRENIGIVFQESFLFRGTIWKNLSYGRPQTTIEEGLEAAYAAGAHHFICRTPLGYETLLGESGAGLSGGEKQRLSIARTLLYAPQILVLDEATSNIDAESERSIQEALEVLIRGRTTVAIAHRLSTLRNADRILVFDRGRIVEHGSHSELIAADGVYARLVRIQTQVAKDPNVDKLLNVHTTAQGAGEHQATPVRDMGECAASASSTSHGGPDSSLPEKVVTPQSPALRTIHWLDPAQFNFQVGSHGDLEIFKGNEKLHGGLFVVRAFPASFSEQYLSVRGWRDADDEFEVGIIRALADWSEPSAAAIRLTIDRRYLLREIRRIQSINLKAGYLDFVVQTDTGQEAFSMRWTQSQAIDFGEEGKLLIDTDDNRYLVRDLSDLPNADAEKFRQYVYW